MKPGHENPAIRSRTSHSRQSLVGRRGRTPVDAHLIGDHIHTCHTFINRQFPGVPGIFHFHFHLHFHSHIFSLCPATVRRYMFSLPAGSCSSL